MCAPPTGPDTTSRLTALFGVAHSSALEIDLSCSAYGVAEATDVPELPSGVPLPCQAPHQRQRLPARPLGSPPGAGRPPAPDRLACPGAARDPRVAHGQPTHGGDHPPDQGPPLTSLPHPYRSPTFGLSGTDGVVFLSQIDFLA